MFHKPGPMITFWPRSPRMLAQVVAASAAEKPRPLLSQYGALAAVFGTSPKHFGNDDC